MLIDLASVNAFTANQQGGSPAGVILDGPGLAGADMQWIARQPNSPETIVFVFPDPNATHRLRFFTAKTELSLCGHATIAAWSLMYTRGIHKSGLYTQRTIAGISQISLSSKGQVFMEQPDQVFGHFVEPANIEAALGIKTGFIDQRFKPQIVRGNLLLGLKSKELLLKLKLNDEQIIKFGDADGFDCLHVFTLLGSNDTLAAVRNFDPGEGISEDIASGTTNGSLLAYLNSRQALPRQETYTIEQGESLGRLSFIYGKLQGDRVWVGGTSGYGGSRQIDQP